MCPDREIISAFLDGEINPPWDRVIAEHVSSCPRCGALHAGLLRTRQALREQTTPELTGPMERVRQRILRHVPVPSPRVPPWRRQVSVPVPVAVVAAALLLTLGVTLAMLVVRSNVGYVRVTKAPAGGTEYQFAIPYDKVEALLKSVGGADANIESVMTIPKNVKLVPVGEPRMGKANEFPRKKP